RPAGAAGLNLRWTDCFGDGGASNRTLACNSCGGSNTLVATFVLPSDVDGVACIQGAVDIAVAASSLPSWWELKNPGSCRKASLWANSIPPGSATICQDWANGTATVGVVAYTVGVFGPNTAEVLVASDANAGQTLVGNQEYFGFNLVINISK